MIGGFQEKGKRWTFAIGVVCRQGRLTPRDTWSCPIWVLEIVFCWNHWHSIIHYTNKLWSFAWFDFWPIMTPWFDTNNSCPWLDLLLNLTLLNISFHGASATGVICRQGTLTPPDTWSRPNWGLHMFCLLKYQKRLLLRCLHHFKSDWINNMDHMHMSGNEPSTVILSQTKWIQK